VTVLVGTASWTDKTLIASKKFYPKGCSTAEARLRFYASQFPLVEVDSSYYAMPAPATAQLWADRTPEGFTMNVKAFRLFTGHQTEPRVLHADIQHALGPKPKRMYYYRDFAPEIRDELWRRFIEALEPLKTAGKLGLVHFQFAPWVLPDPEWRAHIADCVERMAGHTLSLEFRQRTWFDTERHTEKTLAMERELGVVHTVVDGPQGFANSVPAVWAATHPRVALVRMHGHNAETWNIEGAKSASDRFNYDYPDDELASLAPSIETLADQVEFTHVVLNNNMEDQGQRNAASLIRILSERGRATPAAAGDAPHGPPGL
jgi:uncharacterized protein YecE (DUF72 family)